ncbi:probable serine/threonine-protein kinase PBL17 isoform X1 [Coffea arabica]|uniref:Probable serine/threonine-protein kinase PBL17 isoform X1 n=1 Tax=Coffea arabica TaxID=13443 RepID=A0A6P6V5P9_COFAR
MEHQKPVIPGQPAKRGKTSNEQIKSMVAGDFESEEQKKIRNFIEQLRNLDVSFYAFRRDNFLKSPYSLVLPLPDQIVRYENMGNPVEGIDLGKVKHFSHDKMIQITSDFSENNYIRKSTFGRLFRGKIDEGSGMPPREVIVKRWDFLIPFNPTYGNYPVYYARQLEILLNPHVASHPRMAKLIGYCCDKMFALVFDVNLNLTVKDLIPRDNFTWSPRMKVARQVAETLRFFHGKQIALCNFTAPSISVDEDYNIQLFEFDRAANLASDNFPVLKTIVGGAYNYYSPEYLTSVLEFRREWFFTSDVYAFGLLLLELTLAKCAVEERPVNFVEWAKIAFAKNERYDRFKMTIAVPQLLIFDLAMKCVQEDPKMRPHMDEIVMELDKLSQFKTENRGLLG